MVTHDATSHLRSPLDAFEGNLEPTRVSPVYRLGLVLVAIVMVLLPAVYVGLIGAVGAFVGLHAVRHVAWMGSKGGLLIYLGPIVVGTVMIIFMVKPLFARPAKQPEPYSLEPETEPLLFAFIERICRQVRAPLPRRVDLDVQVNASASFRRGIWSLLGNDLVLTIGMPLAAGLSMREFAGVLAHEFGHFAQGGGMRFTYIIRAVSHWFARVVYERDAWDEKLAEYSQNTDIRLGIVLYAARGCVWLTRKLLWVLMMLGNLISCFMLRQMEFDADSYEIKLAGSEAFVRTAHRLQVLGVASQISWKHLEESWQSKRLPDNFPLFATRKTAEVPASVLEQIQASQKAGKTAFLDTHPCDAERVAQANAMQLPGIFRVEAPAAALFADFAAASREVTRHAYAQMLGEKLQADALVPTEETLQESEEIHQGYEAGLRMLNGLALPFRPMQVTEHDLLPLPDPDLSRRMLLAKREEVIAQQKEAQEVVPACLQAYDELRRAYMFQQLREAGFTLKEQELKLPGKSLDETLEFQLRALDPDQPAVERFDRLSAAARQRLVAALQLLAAPGMADKVGGPAILEEARRMARLIARLAPVLPRLIELNKTVATMKTILNACSGGQISARAGERMDAFVEQVNGQVAAIDRQLDAEFYPFKHAKGRVTLAEFARADGQHDHPWVSAVMQCDAYAEKLFSVYTRALGRLAVIAELAEHQAVTAAEKK